VECVVAVSGVSEEVFVARVISDGKVTVPRRVREVLQLEKGDYVRVTITEVIRKKQQQQQKARTKRRR
jgi:bifunctional DNA-binding transcriptional regulator/antitoxin component of YhaV-PrlF toxin-antitoxin module